MTEQQPEANAQETLNQITDIIVNEYEAGYRYSRRELSRILNSIVEVIDRREGRKAEARPAPVERLSGDTELEIQQRHSRPVVSAEIHSDDFRSEASFQANRWLTVATGEEIKALAAIAWGGDREADEVACFMEPKDLGVERVLDYSRTAVQTSGDRMGFEVHVDETEARAWLAVHRPGLLREMTKA